MIRIARTAAFAFLLAAASAAQTIDFEIGAGTCFYLPGGGALTTEYAALGVVFMGPGPGDGGAALDECGGFGADAVSGTGLLAFNVGISYPGGGAAIGPQTVLLPAGTSSVSIWGAGGHGSGAIFEMEAFASSTSVALDSEAVAGGNNWVQLSVSHAAGIDLIELREVSGDGAWVFDDLEFSGTSGGTNYCTGVVNSTGLGASMSVSGSTSVSANNLVLVAMGVPNQPGLFHYGSDQAQLPFGNGFRCVGGTVGRLDVHTGSQNTLIHVLDNTTAPSAATIITSGSTWNFQCWYRDPAAGGAAFNLSDGIALSFLP